MGTVPLRTRNWSENGVSRFRADCDMGMTKTLTPSPSSFVAVEGVAPRKLPISVVILTHDEEANIEACLESVCDWADEVFVVDSGSHDRTVEIARRFTP